MSENLVQNAWDWYENERDMLSRWSKYQVQSRESGYARQPVIPQVALRSGAAVNTLTKKWQKKRLRTQPQKTFLDPNCPRKITNEAAFKYVVLFCTQCCAAALFVTEYIFSSGYSLKHQSLEDRPVTRKATTFMRPKTFSLENAELLTTIATGDGLLHECQRASMSG